jgi:peptidoglycan/LPS O-acetylase OafA/YrhL
VIGPLWSLPWEVQMYVVLPFVFLGLRAGKARLVGVLALCIVLVNVVGVGTGHRVFRIFDFVPCFMAGILSFVRLSWPKGRIPAFFWPLALILLVIAYAASGLGWPLRRIYVADWIACTIVGLLIPQFQDLPNNFVTAAAHQVAKYSYGIYLFHLPVIWLSFDCLAGIGTAASVLLFLIATAVLSIAGYHLIEEPMIRAGKRFAN